MNKLISSYLHCNSLFFIIQLFLLSWIWLLIFGDRRQRLLSNWWVSFLNWLSKLASWEVTIRPTLILTSPPSFSFQYGPYSEPLRVSTGAGPPDAPTELTASCVTTSVVLLSWQKPCFNGADITEYRVEKASENGTFSLVSPCSTLGRISLSVKPETFTCLKCLWILLVV